MLPRLLALVLLAAAAACSSEGTSSECTKVCQLEAACVDKIDDSKDEDEEQNKFDQSECIAACDALSRDEVGKELVRKHTDCALLNKDNCPALLQCK